MAEFQKQHLFLADELTIYVFEEIYALLEGLFFFTKFLIPQSLFLITFTLPFQFLLILLQPRELLSLHIAFLQFADVGQLVLLEVDILL